MPYDPQRHHRRSLRLKGYDYTQPGAYFVTICTQHGECLFGNVTETTMVFSHAGCMVQAIWEQLPQRFLPIELDAYVVMPNHFHAIVIFVGASLVGAPLVDCQDKAFPVSARSRAGTRPAPTVQNPSLGDVVGAFKSITTNAYINGVRRRSWPPFDRRLWQRNYYEHMVRTERALQAIQQYIADNPARWHLDRYNPVATGRDPQAQALWELLQSDR